MENLNIKKRPRDESTESVEPVESPAGSPEVKRIRDDLLGFLEDADPEPAIQDLDSLMRSFEEEIATVSSSPVPVVDLTSDPGQSQPDLGYLLEASDDELGLPPSGSGTSNEENGVTELIRVSSTDSSGIEDLWRFEDQIPNYDAFELENGDVYGGDGGLFEYSTVYFDSSDNSEFLWRQETTPAV